MGAHCGLHAMKPFRRQETWDLLAENRTSLMIKIYKHTDTFKYCEPQPPSHRSFVASNVWPPRPLHSRWRTASCAESWRVCAPWRTGSRVRWAPQLTFQPHFFHNFSHCRRLELPLHARALHLVIPGRLSQFGGS